MHKILHKYHSIKNRKRNRRSWILFHMKRQPVEKGDFEISARTLKMIEESVANFKRGIVSGPIDLSNL